jgi:hypothetical protein
VHYLLLAEPYKEKVHHEETSVFLFTGNVVVLYFERRATSETAAAHFLVRLHDPAGKRR